VLAVNCQIPGARPRPIPTTSRSPPWRTTSRGAPSRQPWVPANRTVSDWRIGKPSKERGITLPPSMKPSCHGSRPRSHHVPRHPQCRLVGSQSAWRRTGCPLNRRLDLFSRAALHQTAAGNGGGDYAKDAKWIPRNTQPVFAQCVASGRRCASRRFEAPEPLRIGASAGCPFNLPGPRGESACLPRGTPRRLPGHN